VRQVLANLVGNTVRYTGSGSVAVRIDGTEALRMVVADIGPGILHSHQASVFERFAKADPGRPRSRPGAGLGLAIARDLVGLMRGTLVLASLPGSGTTVTVTLPLPRDGAPPPPPFPARVLIAEPRPASRAALAAACARQEIAADAAAAAEEASQLAGLAASSRRPYDAAILTASGDAAADAALAQGLRRLGIGAVVLAGAPGTVDASMPRLPCPRAARRSGLCSMPASAARPGPCRRRGAREACWWRRTTASAARCCSSCWSVPAGG
jgi:hypothetical protein